MAYYSIGDVAERCGINPVTLRAWQRRYGLLKPQRSEGGHRLFDEEDIQRIEEIKRWISNGVPVGKVKALLETTSQDTEDDWSRLQEEMMSILRMANPAKLRARIISLGREYPVDQLINHVYLPVRQRLVLDHNTSRIMSSMFDGALIEYAAASLFEMRRKPGKEAILMAWNVEERARLWLEAWRLSLSGWHISVLADPLEAHALVLAAGALPVTGRAEDLFAEQTVLLRLQRTVVDGFRLLDLTVAPTTDVIGGGKADANLVKCVDVQHLLIRFCS